MIIELLCSLEGLGILILSLGTISLWLGAGVLAEAIAEKVHAAVLALIAALTSVSS